MSKPRRIQQQIDEANAAQKVLDDGGQPAQAQPEPKTQPTPPAMAEPSASPQADDLQRQIDELMQQNQTLRGKIDAEGPRNAEEIRKLKEANRALTEQIKVSNQPSLDEAMERLKQEYEPSVLEDIMTLIRSETQPIAAQATQAGQQVGSIAAQSFGSTLKSLVSDYEQINVNPAFAQFVDKPIPLGDGETYRARLLRKREANDAYGVAEVFNAFKLNQPDKKPSNQEPDLPFEPGGGSGGGKPDASNQPKIWTGEEIEAAYKRMRNMLPEDKAKLQSVLDQAQAEGRYQP